MKCLREARWWRTSCLRHFPPKMFISTDIGFHRAAPRAAPFQVHQGWDCRAEPGRICQESAKILQAPPLPTSTPAAPQLRTAQPVPGDFIWRRKAFAQVKRTVSMDPQNLFTTPSSRCSASLSSASKPRMASKIAGSPAFYGILRCSASFYAGCGPTAHYILSFMFWG